MKLVSLLSLFIFISCATTTPGIKIETGTEDVSVFVRKDNDYSNERVQMLHFAIKNNTDEWIDFEGAQVDQGEFSVLLGERLDAWIQACSIEKSVQNHNTNLLLGSLAVAGAAVAVSSNHQQTSLAGGLVALGSISAMSIRDYQKTKKWAEMQFAFPENHVFRSFSIPPRKAIHRWIVIENDPTVLAQFRAVSKDKKRTIFLNN